MGFVVGIYRQEGSSVLDSSPYLCFSVGVFGRFGKPGLRLSPMFLNGWLVEAGPENDVGAGTSGQVQRESAAKRPNREPFRCGHDSWTGTAKVDLSL